MELILYNRKKSYLGGYEKGDIIEVKPDGFFTGKKARGYNKKIFVLVILKNVKPDYTLKDSILLNGKLIKKRKWKTNINLNSNKINITDISELQLKDKRIDK